MWNSLRRSPGQLLRHKTWFKSFFEPASGEIESLLFASQAALGAGVVGYAIGLYKGRSQQQKREE